MSYVISTEDNIHRGIDKNQLVYLYCSVMQAS